MTEQNLYNFLFTVAKANSLIKVFHIGYLDDLNAGDTLDSIYVTPQTKQYPLIVMPPPVSNPVANEQGWEKYALSFFFMDTKNQDNDLTRKVGTREEVWIKMSQTAWDFYTKLRELQLELGLTDQIRFIEDDTSGRIDRVKEYGNDKLTGARMDLVLQIFRGCATESQFATINFTNGVFSIQE